MKDKLIAKQKELIETFYDKPNNPPLVWFIQRDKLLLEIALLEKQIEEQEEKPFYDEDYLQECITKAKTNLSKIVDVDKELDEIRGVDVKENYYEKEFVEWMIDNSITYLKTKRKYCLFKLLISFNTIDELHQYWLENIKDK